MYRQHRVAVVVPALDEALNIAAVIAGLLKLPGDHGGALIDQLVVCDNGSSDGTAAIAMAAGAEVVAEPERGYGAACIRAIQALHNPDIVVFVDGDQSVDPQQLPQLLMPFAPLESLTERADLTIGVRKPRLVEAGALTLPQRFGNQLATTLIQLLWKRRVADLGPFRAIRYSALTTLNMQDRAFGWTVEMQIKAIQQQLTVAEVPVSCKCRLGKSKISGTVRGVWGAACGILGTIVRLRWQQFKLTLSLPSQAH